MSDLKLIKNELSHNERIQERIEAFKRDILSGDADTLYVSDVLSACYEYLDGFEDRDIFMATGKLREAIFYIDYFNDY